MTEFLNKILNIELTNWLTIAAIIIGPIAAIQVQKLLEYRKSLTDRQIQIFRTLMATRANRIAREHVVSLNMIDIEFSEKRKKEKPVVIAWRELLDQFGKFPDSRNYQDNNEFLNVQREAQQKAEDLLITLLFEMSKCLGYNFERIHIKNGCYTPTGHRELDDDNYLIRKGAIALLTGRIPLSMNVQSLPEQAPHENVANFLEASLETQQEIINALKQILEGNANFCPFAL